MTGLIADFTYLSRVIHKAFVQFQKLLPNENFHGVFFNAENGQWTGRAVISFPTEMVTKVIDLHNDDCIHIELGEVCTSSPTKFT
jgi:hypothetical protein